MLLLSQLFIKQPYNQLCSHMEEKTFLLLNYHYSSHHIIEKAEEDAGLFIISISV